MGHGYFLLFRHFFAGGDNVADVDWQFETECPPLSPCLLVKAKKSSFHLVCEINADSDAIAALILLIFRAPAYDGTCQKLKKNLSVASSRGCPYLAAGGQCGDANMVCRKLAESE